jgi:hypothetical protein
MLFYNLNIFYLIIFILIVDSIVSGRYYEILIYDYNLNEYI